jgi:hypothetical protein
MKFVQKNYESQLVWVKFWLNPLDDKIIWKTFIEAKQDFVG